MSSREDTSEDTLLPTPASTPAPDNKLDETNAESTVEENLEDSSSAESFHSTHALVPNNPVLPSVMATNQPVDNNTPAQRQSIKVNGILSKIVISTKLTASNYASWSNSIRFGLGAAASYDEYLDSDTAHSDGIDPSVHLATKKSIFHWLLAHMEQVQSTRFISTISTFENGIKKTPPSPSLLWKAVRDYHISNSESVKLMLRSEITDLSQGSTKDLLEYIDMFRAKVDAYLGANGEMSEEEQACQFVRSLNREWAEKGCDLLNAGHVKFRNLEVELKKTYQTRKMFNSGRQQSSRVIDTSESSHGRRTGRWQTCSKNRCIGRDHPTKPHKPSECYHHPNNSSKMEAWKKSKRDAGEWVEYPRGSRGSSRGRGRGGANFAGGYSRHIGGSNYPDSRELESAFEGLKLEDQEFSYHVDIDGHYSCSAKPQLACIGDQCSSVALIDTGASHHMFHDASLFEVRTLIANDDPGAKLNLAGHSLSGKCQPSQFQR